MNTPFPSLPSPFTTPRQVIVRLNSGLGNQLFQLAHGMWLAEKWNATLRFDTTGSVSSLASIP